MLFHIHSAFSGPPSKAPKSIFHPTILTDTNYWLCLDPAQSTNSKWTRTPYLACWNSDLVHESIIVAIACLHVDSMVSTWFANKCCVDSRKNRNNKWLCHENKFNKLQRNLQNFFSAPNKTSLSRWSQFAVYWERQQHRKLDVRSLL